MSAEAVAAALRQALATGDPKGLAGHYAPDARLESYLTGVRETARGAEAIVAGWPHLLEPLGEPDGWEVTTEAGGLEVDASAAAPDGGSAWRQVHRLHLHADGAIRWHLVFPARPREQLSADLPASLGVDPGSVEPFPHGGFSGAALFRARSTAGEPVVVKHLRPHDWMPRATRDRGREALLHADGVHAHLPAALATPVLAAEQVADGWLLVMRDVSAAHEAVMSGSAPDALPRMLRAMHELHLAFADRPAGDALCRLADRLQLFGPARPMVERHGVDLLPKTLIPMWDTFAERIPPDLVTAILQVTGNPGRLLDELAAEQPQTLLHGDFQPTNLGIDGDTVVALDWGLAAYGPPEVDYVWFLSNAAWEGDDERERIEALWTDLTGTPRDSRAADLAVVFHAAMGELGFLVTEPEYALAGAFVPSPETVAWWTARIRASFDRLGDLG